SAATEGSTCWKGTPAGIGWLSIQGIGQGCLRDQNCARQCTEQQNEQQAQQPATWTRLPAEYGCNRFASPVHSLPSPARDADNCTPQSYGCHLGMGGCGNV
ncbi:MAG: hypothetical protein KAY24_10415, partial [Candidatus Eisenbacteria sp.]|nr:hypothetical protein [Candidatus Eisenbacteria bacterium]